MNFKTLAAAACLSLAAASPSQAATFDFFWSAADPAPTQSDDPSVRAVGTFDLDVESGAFGNANISNIMIAVTGDRFGSFTLDALGGLTAGAISADGGSVTFSSLSFTMDAYGYSNFATFQTQYRSVVFYYNAGYNLLGFQYASDADVQGSFSATTPISAVPLPAGGLLLLSAFGGVAALKRRKNRAA